MSRQIRVGIAGLGRSGFGIHAEYLKTDPRFLVTAAADELEERRKDAEQLFHCRTFRNHTEMLAAGGFDLFINATPSRFHGAASMEALQTGVDVLSEKPSATSIAEFDRILKTAEQNGRQFFPFQNSRFYPYFRKLQSILNSGVLGKLICIRSNWSSYARRWDWQTRQEECGGNLFNTGPHPVDQAVALIGDVTPNVFCRMAAEHFDFGGDANNFCALTLYGENMPVVEIQISSFQVYAQGDQYNIQGLYGGLTGGPNGLRWKYFDPEKAPRHTLWRPWSDQRQYCQEKLDWQEETWNFASPESNANGFTGLSAGFYGNLYDVLTCRAERAIRLDQVRRQIQIMEEAHRQNPLARTVIE